MPSEGEPGDGQEVELSWQTESQDGHIMDPITHSLPALMSTMC